MKCIYNQVEYYLLRRISLKKSTSLFLGSHMELEAFIRSETVCRSRPPAKIIYY